MLEGEGKSEGITGLLYYLSITTDPPSDEWLKKQWFLFPVMGLWVEPSSGWVQPDGSSPLLYMIRALAGCAGLCRALAP